MSKGVLVAVDLLAEPIDLGHVKHGHMREKRCKSKHQSSATSAAVMKTTPGMFSKALFAEVHRGTNSYPHGTAKCGDRNEPKEPMCSCTMCVLKHIRPSEQIVKSVARVD